MRTCLFTDLTISSEINLVRKERRDYCACGVTCLFTYSMEQSPSWEANWLSVSQEIHHVLWDPKVHYRDYKCPTPAPILGQINPVLAHPFHLLRFHRNIIPPSTPGSFAWFLSLMFPPPKLCMHLFCPQYVLLSPPVSFSIWWLRSTDH